MDFKNAVKALQIGKKEGKKFRLSTEFGKNPEEELPFPEYPRGMVCKYGGRTQKEP